jgi:hypothetical protein
VVEGVPAGAAVDGASALRFVGAPQASKSRPVMHTMKRKNFDICFSLFGMAERADNTPCFLFYG